MVEVSRAEQKSLILVNMVHLVIMDTKSILLILFLVSFVWIVLCLWIYKLRRLINSTGVVSLFYQFAIAYIIGYGFYFLTVTIPERKNTRNVNVYVIPKTKNIIGDAYSLFNEFAKKADVPKSEFPPKKKELQSILEKINPQINDAPMVTSDLRNIGWIQYLNNMRERSQEFIKKITNRMPYLNTDLLRLLTQIDDNSYFHYIEVLTPSLTNTDLTFLTDGLLSYFDSVKKLEEFVEEEYNESLRYNDLFLTK